MKLILENWKKFINEKVAPGTQKKLQQIPLTDPGAAKDYLQDLEPEERAALAKGKEDAKPGDEIIKIAPMTPSVGDLEPTQQEISLMGSIGFPLSSIDSLENIKTGDPKGENDRIVTAGPYVIDGHHRWSSIFAMAGPGGKILARNVALPGKDSNQKLAVAQVGIVATMDPKARGVPEAEMEGGEGEGPADNILGNDAKSIKTMITKVIGQVHPKTGKKILGDEYVELAKNSADAQTYFKISQQNDTKIARSKIVNQVATNLAAIPSNPAAPARIDMPQFTGGDTHAGQFSDEDVFATMQAGAVNFKPPFE